MDKLLKHHTKLLINASHRLSGKDFKNIFGYKGYKYEIDYEINRNGDLLMFMANLNKKELNKVLEYISENVIVVVGE